MNDVPETVLHESLDLLEQGESIEQILLRYPNVVDGLRPFLETAAQLVTLAPQPSLAAKQQSQKAFLSHAAGLKVAPVRPSPWYRLRQILLPIASLAVVLILFTTTTVSVSGSAIPGDALYSVKLLVETVRLNLASDPAEVAAQTEENRQERIREAQILLRTGRVADVTFEGEVEAIQPEVWTVASLEVQLNEATIVTGRPQVGEWALVNGRTENGELTALTIAILSGPVTEPEATPQPTPNATSDPQPTTTPEPTTEPTTNPTATPTTATLTPSPTPSPTKTPTVTPTVTATRAAPTATPSPTQPPTNDNGDDDNNNDGDNDSNDNGNDNDVDGGSNSNDNNNGNANDNEGNANDSNDNSNTNNSNDNDEEEELEK